MGFRVAEEGLEEARKDVVAALEANRRSPIHPDRFDWLYGSNPDGNAVIWTIRKEDTGELAGFTVAIPRRMCVDGQSHAAWNCADFSIFPRFRTLGIAIKLRRAAKDGVDAGRVSFLYAHPNEKMELVHQKVGHFPVGTMVRYAKVLKSRRYLQESVPNRFVAAVASVPIDAVLRLKSPEWRRVARSRISVISPSRFDSRFEQLFSEARTNQPVVGVRDARYLSWRYGNNPLYQSSVVVAECGGSLRGYAIFSVDEEATANIKDIFPADDPGLTADLIGGVVRECRMRGLNSISATVLDENRAIPGLMKFGFVRRAETSHMYAYARDDSPLRAIIQKPSNWFLTVGDRDV